MKIKSLYTRQETGSGTRDSSENVTWMLNSFLYLFASEIGWWVSSAMHFLLSGMFVHVCLLSGMFFWDRQPQEQPAFRATIPLSS